MTEQSNKHFIVSDWQVVWGYVTGIENTGSESWFSRGEHIHNKTLPEAMFLTRGLGYAENGDICADFIFHVRDLKAEKDLDADEIALSLAVAERMLIDEVG
mgnify:CR=1 FL=1